MTPEIRQKILSFRAERHPYSAIARATGLSHLAILRFFRENGVLLAVAQADSLELARQEFGVSAHQQKQYLADNLAKVEQELKRRSLTVLPTVNLQHTVTALHAEATTHDSRGSEESAGHLEKAVVEKQVIEKELLDQDVQPFIAGPVPNPRLECLDGRSKRRSSMPTLHIEITLSLARQQLNPKSNSKSLNNPKPKTKKSK